MFTSAIKKQTSDICCSISLNPFIVFQTWKSGIMEKKEKRKAILLLAYIADVSCLTNRLFYMRTLSLINIFNFEDKLYKIIYYLLLYVFIL